MNHHSFYCSELFPSCSRIYNLQEKYTLWTLHFPLSIGPLLSAFLYSETSRKFCLYFLSSSYPFHSLPTSVLSLSLSLHQNHTLKVTGLHLYGLLCVSVLFQNISAFYTVDFFLQQLSPPLAVMLPWCSPHFSAWLLCHCWIVLPKFCMLPWPAKAHMILVFIHLFLTLCPISISCLLPLGKP